MAKTSNGGETVNSCRHLAVNVLKSQQFFAKNLSEWDFTWDEGFSVGGRTNREVVRRKVGEFEKRMESEFGIEMDRLT